MKSSTGEFKDWAQHKKEVFGNATKQIRPIISIPEQFISEYQSKDDASQQGGSKGDGSSQHGGSHKSRSHKSYKSGSHHSGGSQKATVRDIVPVIGAKQPSKQPPGSKVPSKRPPGSKDARDAGVKDNNGKRKDGKGIDGMSKLDSKQLGAGTGKQPGSRKISKDPGGTIGIPKICPPAGVPVGSPLNIETASIALGSNNLGTGSQAPTEMERPITPDQSVRMSPKELNMLSPRALAEVGDKVGSVAQFMAPQRNHVEKLLEGSLTLAQYMEDPEPAAMAMRKSTTLKSIVKEVVEEAQSARRSSEIEATKNACNRGNHHLSRMANQQIVRPDGRMMIVTADGKVPYIAHRDSFGAEFHRKLSRLEEPIIPETRLKGAFSDSRDPSSMGTTHRSSSSAQTANSSDYRNSRALRSYGGVNESGKPKFASLNGAIDNVDALPLDRLASEQAENAPALQQPIGRAGTQSSAQAPGLDPFVGQSPARSSAHAPGLAESTGQSPTAGQPGLLGLSVPGKFEIRLSAVPGEESQVSLPGAPDVSATKIRVSRITEESTSFAKLNVSGSPLNASGSPSKLEVRSSKFELSIRQGSKQQLEVRSPSKLGESEDLSSKPRPSTGQTDGRPSMRPSTGQTSQIERATSRGTEGFSRDSRGGFSGGSRGGLRSGDASSRGTGSGASGEGGKIRGSQIIDPSAMTGSQPLDASGTPIGIGIGQELARHSSILGSKPLADMTTEERSRAFTIALDSLLWADGYCSTQPSEIVESEGEDVISIVSLTEVLEWIEKILAKHPEKESLMEKIETGERLTSSEEIQKYARLQLDEFLKGNVKSGLGDWLLLFRKDALMIMRKQSELVEAEFDDLRGIRKAMMKERRRSDRFYRRVNRRCNVKKRENVLELWPIYEEKFERFKKERIPNLNPKDLADRVKGKLGNTYDFFKKLRTKMSVQKECQEWWAGPNRLAQKARIFGPVQPKERTGSRSVSTTKTKGRNLIHPLIRVHSSVSPTHQKKLDNLQSLKII